MSPVQDGDISNEWSPRVVFVFEHLLAELSLRQVRAEVKACKRRRWKQAVGYWEPVEPMLNLLHDLAYRVCVPVDVLSIHGMDGFGDAVTAWLEERQAPVGHVYSATVADFSRELAYRPEIRIVYHGDAGSPLLFGGRGRVVQRPTDVMRFL